MPIPDVVAAADAATPPTSWSALLHTPFHRSHHAARLVAVVGCAAIAFMLLLSGSAHGQAAASTTPSKGENTPLSSTITDGGSTTTGNGSSGGSLVRTIVGLLIVIAVIYGITWVLKQGKKKAIAGSDDDYGTGLEPTAMLTLAGRAGLHLVRVGNEYLLLGVSDNGVNQLRSYTEDEARAAGFPIEDDDVDTLRPTGKGRPQLGPGTPFVERLRDLTVRR